MLHFLTVLCLAVCVFSHCVGAASKRFGIDGDREAVPLKLDVVYNRVRCCLNLFTAKMCVLKLHLKTIVFLNTPSYWQVSHHLFLETLLHPKEMTHHNFVKKHKGC